MVRAGPSRPSNQYLFCRGADHALQRRAEPILQPSGNPRTRTGPNDIWVAHRDCRYCAWLPPQRLGPPINTPFNNSGAVLSRDGHSLFFFSNRPGSVPAADGAPSHDLWVAWRDNVHDDFAWGTPENLGGAVNTAGFEGGPSYFENDEGGAELYFNRNPINSGLGGDIYVAQRGADGSFAPAVPVAELNSPASDQRPSIAHSGLELYFFSNRPGSLNGSNDIWVSTRDSIELPWGTPVNLGETINTGVGEVHPLIVSHGDTDWLYFAHNVATPPDINLDIFVSTRTR